MMNLHELLEKARLSGQRLLPNEAAVLFAAAVRLAAAQNATLRGRLLQVDDTGVLHLLPFDERAPESEPSFLAPELLGKDAPRKTEPRVQVYAAGALGYELLTGHAAPKQPPGAELQGALGDIVRMALSHDRRERFGDLTQLQEALEGVQARPPVEGERNILSALRLRLTRQPPEREALSRLIEKVHSLEVHVGKSQQRIDQLHAQMDRVEEGLRRAAARKQPSVIVPAFLAGVIGAAAVLGAGWAMGLASRQMVTDAPKPAPVNIAAPGPQKAPEVVAPQTKSAPDAPAVAAPVDAGVAQTQAAVEDAGSPPSVAAVLPDAGPAAEKAPPAPAAPAPAAQHVKPPPVSPAAMSHALALSQIHRGETALEHGHTDEALSSFRSALDNEPGLAAAYRGMGMAYAMQGSDAQALQAYGKYLQLAPSAPDVKDIRNSMAELKDRSKVGGGE
jgi:tetratricopeptide (TPR) repeat protein